MPGRPTTLAAAQRLLRDKGVVIRWRLKSRGYEVKDAQGRTVGVCHRLREAYTLAIATAGRS